MIKILILGANGQVGWELQRALAPLGHVTALSRWGEGGWSGDLIHPESLVNTVRNIRPDVIVNAAAYTAVDRAEDEPDMAEAVNVIAVLALARAAKSIGALLVHYSTDYVFDGAGEHPKCESDDPRPINVYGRTKLEGETAILESGCRFLILRTSWVYAAHGENFIMSMLRLIASRDYLQIVNDQYGAPTAASLIADVTSHILLPTINAQRLGGVYHLCASGETTWYGYASRIIACAREYGWPVRVPESAIAPVSTDNLSGYALRPRNSRLDCSKIEATFGLRMPAWCCGVDYTLQEILASRGYQTL